MGHSSDSDSSHSSGSSSGGYANKALKEAEKQRKKMAKEAEKQRKKLFGDYDKEQKHTLKEAEKQQRKAMKEAEKQQKHAAKEANKHNHAHLGQSILSSAFMGTPLPTSAAQPIVPSKTLRVVRTHDIDESRPDYFSHGIIRVEEGDYVELLDGSLQTGLPPPYSDYVLVRTSKGKVGKVGKLCFF